MGHVRRRRARPRVGRRIGQAFAALCSAAAAAVTIAAGVGAIPGVEAPTTTYVTMPSASGEQVGDDELSDRAEGGERGSRSGRDTPSTTQEPTTESPTPSPEPSKTIPPTTKTPEPIEVPTAASGDLTVIGGDATASDSAARIITYRVELEDGLPFDGAEVAEFVHTVLEDERGWPGVSDVRFSRTHDDAELRIIVASPSLTDQLCAPLDTGGELSCRIEDRVVLNAMRWAEGTPDYAGQLEAYRTYLVNHEVGHSLGYGHAECPGAGEPAPVMMQQTKGIGECEINPWPTVAIE